MVKAVDLATAHIEEHEATSWQGQNPIGVRMDRGVSDKNIYKVNLQTINRQHIISLIKHI